MDKSLTLPDLPEESQAEDGGGHGLERRVEQDEFLDLRVRELGLKVLEFGFLLSKE